MYMFLMMSGIFLQHCPVNKTMLYAKNGKKCIQTYTFLSFYESVFYTFEALRIDSQKTNTHVHVPYDVRHLSTAFNPVNKTML